MYPGTNRQVAVTPVTEIVVGDIRRPLVVLFGAVALVLLLSCANVAHMLLARATSRVKEVAVRAALGASRAQLIRQFLVESLVLASAGGLLGLALASQAISLIVALAGRSVPRIDTAVIDGRVVMFAALVSMASALLCGLMPALRGSRADLVAGLRDVDRGATSGGEAACGGRCWSPPRWRSLSCSSRRQGCWCEVSSPCAPLIRVSTLNTSSRWWCQ